MVGLKRLTSRFSTTRHRLWVQLKLTFFLLLLLCRLSTAGMFTRLNWLDGVDTTQRNYGVAVADVDADGTGDFEWIVAGFTGANFVLKFNTSSGKLDNIAKVGTPYEELRDVDGKAIGVCACDIDGDGREEIYFLNTNRAYAGRSSYGDKLFKWRDGKYVDLFSDPINLKIEAKDFAGRSVACIDRLGTGKYSFIIATYSQGGTGNFALIEMDVTATHPKNNAEDGYIVLKNVAKDVGIEKATGGRGIVVGPILNTDGRSDIFFSNEGNPWLKNPGSNFLFKNLGNGSFIDVANEVGLVDKDENGRGVCLSDFNKDGRVDVVYGNWEGKHRLFLQKEDSGKIMFENLATSEFETPSLIRTVISSDFENDGQLEIFMNNIYEQNNPQPNRLFRVMYSTEGLLNIEQIAIGDALEIDGCGTGAAVADIDGDGNLELLVSHGEDRSQPLQIYGVSDSNNNWIRILPRTKFKAPARGAKVSVTNSLAETQTAVIDCGSGYLCQMEPVAHFGLSDTSAVHLTVQWPDGRSVRQELSEIDHNKLHIVEHPDTVIASTVNSTPINKNNTSNINQTVMHEEL